MRVIGSQAISMSLPPVCGARSCPLVATVGMCDSLSPEIGHAVVDRILRIDAAGVACGRFAARTFAGARRLRAIPAGLEFAFPHVLATTRHTLTGVFGLATAAP